MRHPTLNKILGAVGVALATTATALTAGTLPAIAAGVGAALMWAVGVYHPQPSSTVNAG